MSDLKRNQLNNINRLLESFPAILILGVRQCGKSTLSRNARPDWGYFDLENSKDYDYISSDMDFFLKQHPGQIIIDEAQELPGIFKNLRGVIDRARDQKNRFILTGSSSPDLIKMASDSLAGRIGIIELGTFKFNELHQYPLPEFYQIFETKISEKTISFIKNLSPPKSDVDCIQGLLKGGYPEPVLSASDIFFEDWMENYFQTYINRDIRKLFPKLDSLKYRRFVSMLSELSGTIINKAQLGRSIDVNEVTTRDYLDIAHKTFFWRMIPSYEKTQIKSVTKMPKGILRDTGFMHYLSHIDSKNALLRAPNFGQNFESYAIEEIIKGIQATRVTRWDYFYYRTKNGVEVDLVLDGKFGVLPIEIKSGVSTNIKDLKSLDHFIKQENLPLGLVINNDDKIKRLSEKIMQVPISFL